MKNRQRQAGVKSHFRRNMYLYSFILTVLIILGALTFYLLRTELLKNTQDLGDALARSYSSEERNNLTVYETLLDFGTEIYDSPGQADQPEEEKEQMLKIFFRRIENTLGAGKVNPYAVIGGRIVSHNSWEGAGEYEAEEAEWYQRAMEAGGKAAFTGVYTDAVYGRPVITISRKCDSADVVLALDIFPENFQFQFNPPDLPENASFYLCDENGTLIYAKSAMTDDEEEARRLEKKLIKNKFDFNDFMAQIAQTKKMGNLKDVASMIPGMGKMLKDVDIPDDAFKQTEAIINSMTPAERSNPAIINVSRRERIARGSGTTLADVNRLMKQFDQTRQMMKLAAGGGLQQKMQMMRGGMRRR